jgi:hypothetical protein
MGGEGDRLGAGSLRAMKGAGASLQPLALPPASLLSNRPAILP